MTRNRTHATAIASPPQVRVPLVVSLALFLAFVLISGFAKADENIVKSHGISTFGDLKYGPDFTHLEYVNPEAPKGGTFSTWGFGTFDSMTPYILKGSPAALSTIMLESLMTGTADEPD